jgi:hypothetical protein
VPPHDIAHWAAAYADDYDDARALEIGERVRASGAISYSDFLSLAEWKTTRTKSRCRSNAPSYVAEVTRHALAASEPRFKVEVLRVLDGVDWATASVILHFCDRDRWPILDVRAFWSLGTEVPKYITYPLWEAYTASARELADLHEVSMRTLDRALWAYSKAHQGPLKRF